MKLITWIKVYYRQGEWIWCACCQRAIPACPEMSGSENIPHCPCMAMHLIELSHDPLSSGYTYDLVPPGRAMMECDTDERTHNLNIGPLLGKILGKCIETQQIWIQDKTQLDRVVVCLNIESKGLLLITEEGCELGHGKLDPATQVEFSFLQVYQQLEVYYFYFWDSCISNAKHIEGWCPRKEHLPHIPFGTCRTMACHFWWHHYLQLHCPTIDGLSLAPHALDWWW